MSGVTYDTETDKILADNRYFDGISWERNGRNTFLYKTPTGRFYLCKTTTRLGEYSCFLPLNESEARAHYESLREKRVSYAEAFGGA